MTSRLSRQTVTRKNWIVVLAANVRLALLRTQLTMQPDNEIENIDHYAGTAMQDRSLLTGRTMEEVQAGGRVETGFDDGEEAGYTDQPDGNSAADLTRALQSLRTAMRG